MQAGDGGKWIKPQKPTPLSTEGAIARAAYRFCDGYQPERLALYAAIGRVRDLEMTAELMRLIAEVESETDDD